MRCSSLTSFIHSGNIFSMVAVWSFDSIFGHTSQYNQLLVQNICLKLSRLLLIWAEEQTYWIASRFLMLGFDLELYSPSEYCMVYWYLYVVFIKLLEKVQLRIAGSTDTSEYPLIYIEYNCYFVFTWLQICVIFLLQFKYFFFSWDQFVYASFLTFLVYCSRFIKKLQFTFFLGNYLPFPLFTKNEIYCRGI